MGRFTLFNKVVTLKEPAADAGGQTVKPGRRSNSDGVADGAIIRFEFQRQNNKRPNLFTRKIIWRGKRTTNQIAIAIINRINDRWLEKSFGELDFLRAQDLFLRPLDPV